MVSKTFIHLFVVALTRQIYHQKMLLLFDDSTILMLKQELCSTEIYFQASTDKKLFVDEHNIYKTKFAA